MRNIEPFPHSFHYTHMHKDASLVTPESRFLNSSYEALVDDCVYMGWPDQPDQGRRVVSEVLAEIGITRHNAERLDLYATLNRIRCHSWTGNSEIWNRYVAIRRAEVVSHHSPRQVQVSLTRTIPITPHSEVQRLRLPLPLVHAAHPNPTWRIESVSGEILEKRESSGALDLSIHPNTEVVQAKIVYEAHVTPQKEPIIEELPTPSDLQRVALFQSPLALHPTKIADLGTRSPMERVRALWDIFHDQLASGHIYHHEHLRTATPVSEEGLRWFDCVVGTWLFAEAAQSLGIPARVFSGLILQSYGPSQHYWCELFVDGGWRPFDLYAWDLTNSRDEWRDLFFGSLESRLRFERLPAIHSRFLPNRPWFIERSMSDEGAVFTYRGIDSAELLGKDVWSMA